MTPTKTEVVARLSLDLAEQEKIAREPIHTWSVGETWESLTSAEQDQDAARARCGILATNTSSCGPKAQPTPRVKVEQGQILHIRGQAKVGMDDDDNVVVGRPKIVRVWFEGEDEDGE